MTSVESEILELKRKYSQKWRKRSDWWWLLCIFEEFVELSAALLGLHSGHVEWELAQISSISMNWLEHRRERSNEKRAL